MINPTDTPINQVEIDALMHIPNMDLNIIMQYSPADREYYLFVSYKMGKDTAIRQFQSQRNTLRKFKDPRRAIEWAAKCGFKKLELSIDLVEFK